MSWSLNEIESLARKAARGAGLSWGLAEEAGKATRWLTAAGLPGPEALADLLTRNDGADYDMLCPVEAREAHWSAKGGTLCPLVAGAALCDRAEALAAGDNMTLGQTASPMLLLPYLAAAAQLAGRGLRVSWGELTVTLAGDMHLQPANANALHAPLADSVRIECTGTRLADAPPPAKGRGQMPPDVQQRLNAFAQRTYAPATEASRLAGAGAGLTDND